MSGQHFGQTYRSAMKELFEPRPYMKAAPLPHSRTLCSPLKTDHNKKQSNSRRQPMISTLQPVACCYIFSSISLYIVRAILFLFVREETYILLFLGWLPATPLPELFKMHSYREAPVAHRFLATLLLPSVHYLPDGSPWLAQMQERVVQRFRIRCKGVVVTGFL